MSSSQLPSWLVAAWNSQQQVDTAVRILSARESQRSVARNGSRAQAELATATGSRSPFSFLGLKNKNTQTPNHVEHYSIAAGSHEAHNSMNRYMDVTPYDRTRVVVHNGSVAHGGDQKGEFQGRYLNASWVLEKAGRKWWIATQAPLRQTAHAFLSVMLQPALNPPGAVMDASSTQQKTRVRTVVQLTRNVESGRKKADAYFPTEVGKSFKSSPEEGCDAPQLKVTLQATRSIPEAHCIESTLLITPVLSTPVTGTGNTGVVFKHMLYTSWPDHGVPEPEDRESLLAFIHLVDQANRDTSNCPVHPHSPTNHACTETDPDPPIMIGCSAGIGRTGSFIALSSLLRKYGFLPPATQPASPSIIPASPLGPLPDFLKDDEVLRRSTRYGNNALGWCRGRSRPCSFMKSWQTRSSRSRRIGRPFQSPRASDKVTSF